MRRLFKLRERPLVRSTLWLVGGFTVRAAIQAMYFLIIARALGPGGYGAFAGVVALVALASPFAGVGLGYVLIRKVARDPACFPECWGNGALMTGVSGAALVLLVLAASVFILPHTIPVTLTLAVCLSDLLLVRLVDLSSQAFQSMQRPREAAQLQVLPNALRLIAAGGLALYGPPNAVTWGGLYCLSSACTAFWAVRLVHRHLGAPRVAWRRLGADAREGAGFSLGLAAQNTYNDIDKTMLASMSTLAATGTYAAAYRIIDVSFTPIRSLLFAAYARFFQHGDAGVRKAFAFGKRLLPTALGYSAIAGLAVFLGAGLAPAILGPRFAVTAEALRWLSLLPLLKTLHSFVGDSLTGAGYQWARTAIQLVVSAVNVALNLWLIPAHSWRGAAWASLASDGLLAASLWVTLLVVWGHSGRRSALPATILSLDVAESAG